MHAVQNTVFHVGGYLAPFDMALVVSVGCGVAALYFWEENYGENELVSSHATAKNSPQRAGGLRRAYTVTMRSREILLCGIVSSLYEGSMYVSTERHASKLFNLSFVADIYESDLHFYVDASVNAVFAGRHAPIWLDFQHIRKYTCVETWVLFVPI